MTLLWKYSVDSMTVLDITDRVRLPLDPEGVAIGVGSHADAGSGWEGELLVDDPDGDLIMLQFRRIYCVQDAAPSGAQVIGNWFISNTRIVRMDPWKGAARTWVVSMADENSLISRRKFVGADSNRPEETDIERLRWFLTTTEGNVFDPDEDFIDTAGAVTLDKTDLRTQSPEDMFMSMYQASQKNYWVMYREDLGAYVICYFSQNTSPLYPSTVSFSNDTDINIPSLIYPLSTDAALDRAGGRMASKLVAQFKGGWIATPDDDLTGLAYAYVDRTVPAPNVENAATALAQITRQQVELRIPDDEITTRWRVAEARMNLVMHGMIVPVHALHFPNYTEDSIAPGYATGYVDCRVTERVITQVGPKTFDIDLTLSPMLSQSCAVESIDAYFDEERQEVMSSNEAFSIPAPGSLPYAIVALGNVESAFISVGPEVTVDTSGGEWVDIGDFSVAPGTYWHQVCRTAYNAQPAGVPDPFDLTLGFVEGSAYYTDWSVVAVSVTTAATAPVQYGESSGPTSGNVTLGAPPTAGNVLVMFETVRNVEDTPPDGWTQIAHVEHGQGGPVGGAQTGSHTYVFAACVPDGGMSATITVQPLALNIERHSFVSEWVPV